jgi:hypothetical protein
MKPNPQRLPPLSNSKPNLTASQPVIRESLNIEDSMRLEKAMGGAHFNFDLDTPEGIAACKAYHERRRAGLRSN